MDDRKLGARLQCHQPGPRLSPFVETMWRMDRPGALPHRQRVFPNGAMTLVIHLDSPTATYFVDEAVHCIRVPLIAGPYSRSFLIDPSESNAVIGVVFRPVAARVFFRMPAHELHNVDVPVAELTNDDDADRLMNQVYEATDARSQFRAVERFLERRLESAPSIHPAIAHSAALLAKPTGATRIGIIQRETGFSHTRFIQLFREHVGLTPKLFSRVRRFHHVTEQLQQGRIVDWASLALDCGYSDQAHLIRDFKAFSGLTPSEFSKAPVS